MKRITILLFALLLGVAVQAQDFGGSWGICSSPDSMKWDLGISLWKIGKNYKGDYTYVTQYGNRIEDGVVKVLSVDGNIAKLQLVNTGGIGCKPKVCFIKLLSDKTMMFNYPQNKIDYAYPDSVVMKRNQTEAEVVEVRQKLNSDIN